MSDAGDRLVQLVFRSRPAEPPDNAALKTAIDDWDALHRQLELTGFLIRFETTFVGVIEGARDTVIARLEAMSSDSILAGLTVLWAAVQATRDERRYESAMLRTFGASKRRVLSGVATEFLAIGLLAGVLAASGATLAGFLLAENLFDLEYRFSLELWLAGPLLGMLFVGLSGMAATWRVITHAPVNVLRAA